MIAKIIDGGVFQHFPSLEEFIKHCDSGKLQCGDDKSHKEGEERYSFTGTHNWQSAMELAKLGDKKLGDEIKTKSKRITSMLLAKMKPSQDSSFDKQGQHIDCGRYVMGEPDCWMNNYSDEGRERTATLVAHGGYLAGYTNQQIIGRGIAVCALIYALDCLGVSTEVRIVFPNACGGGRVMPGFTFKRAGEIFSLNRLAVFLAHPSGFRRFGFAALERLPKYAEGLRHHTVELSCLPKSIINMLPKGHIYIPGLGEMSAQCDVGNTDSCLEYIQGILQGKMTTEGSYEM